MKKTTKTKAANGARHTVDASIVVLATTIFVTVLRENGVEVSGALEEMIVLAALLTCGRAGAWLGIKIREKSEERHEQK